MKLVVAVPPRPTESLSGYLLRVAEANGYPNYRYVVAAATGEWTYAPAAALDPRLLVDVVGLTDSQIRTLTMIPEGNGRGMRRIRGIDLPRSELSVERPKVCPRCLAEHGCCEAFWDLAQAVACPVHGTVLISECPHCHKRLGWRRGKVAQCACGAGLTEVQAPQTSNAITTLMTVMRHFVYDDTTIAAMPTGTKHLQPLGLARLCKLLWVMSSDLRYQAGVQKCPKARSRYGAELERVAAALCDWPNGVRAWLENTYGSLVSNSVPQPPFAWTFRWLFTRLLSRRTAGGATDDNLHAYAFLVDEVRAFGRSYWPASALCSQIDGVSLDPIAARWGTRKHAADMLGVRLATLNKLIKTGCIPTRRVSASARRPVLVDLQAVAKMPKPNNNDIVKFRDVAKQLGISIATLKEIRKRNLCGLTQRLTWTTSLSRLEVDELATRLLATAAGKRAVCATDVASVTSAFVAAGATSQESALFLDRLSADSNLVVGCAKHAVGIGRLQVRLKDVKAFIADKRGDRTFMSNGEAATRLRCAPAVVQALARHGHLRRGLCRGRKCPTIESVQQFAKEYEGAAQIARRLGMRSRWLLSHPNLPVVEQLKVRSSQYATTFFHQADVARIEMAIRGAV